MVEERLRKYVLTDNTISQDVKDDIKEVLEELSKYKELYRKALDNTIKSDRELLKYKEINKKAIEYINKTQIQDYAGGNYINISEYEFVRELLKILEEA